MAIPGKGDRPSAREILEEVIQVSAISSPVSVTEAMAMVHAGLGFLAAADATELPCEVQGPVPPGLRAGRRYEHRWTGPDAGRIRQRAGLLRGCGYSPKMWLFHRTRVTKGCAAAHAGWARRAAAHPRLLAALGAAEISTSWARSICDWNDRLPEACREEADEILLGAARQGLDLWDLTRLAGEMFEQSRPEDHWRCWSRSRTALRIPAGTLSL